MKDRINYREQFMKEFIARTTPKLRENIRKKRSYLPAVDTEPIMILGQVIAEIENSISYLKLVPKLITSHSSYYEKKGFSRVQQHRKKIEGYFAEIYILKERVARMLTLLRRFLITNGLTKTDKEIIIIDLLKDNFITSLNGVLAIRGEHTHKYSYQDKELFEMELLDFSYSSSNYSLEDKESLYSELKLALRKDREYWKNRIQKNTDALLRKLDEIYFKIDEYKLLDKI